MRAVTAEKFSAFVRAIAGILAAGSGGISLTAPLFLLVSFDAARRRQHNGTRLLSAALISKAVLDRLEKPART